MSVRLALPLRVAQWLALAGAMVLLSACLGGAGSRDSTTLADLPAPVAPPASQALKVERSTAIAAYRAYLDAADPADALHAPAQQRLADLLQAELDERDALAVGDPSIAAPSEAEREAVAQLYRDLLAAHPERAENAAAWYQLARSEESLGNLEGALLALAALAERFPQTPNLDEVHFRRGEYHFALRDFAAAEQAYARALAAREDSAFREQALYKRGWSLFRLQRFAPALDLFVAVLDRYSLAADDALEDLDAARRQRVEDTLDVIALAFSYQGGAAEIQPYFERIGGRAWKVLVYRRLGEQYLEQQRYTDAAASFRAFAEVEPLARPAPYLLLRAGAAYQRGGFTRQVREVDLRLLDDYGMAQEYWRLHRREAEPVLVAAIRERVRDLTRYHHARFQAGGAPGQVQADLAAAIVWYRRWIAWFADDADTAEANFLLGELLFESGDYRGAVAEFERAAYDYPPHANAAEAAYAALLAYAQAEDRLDAAEREPWQAAKIASSLRFAADFAADARAPQVLLGTAQAVFAAGDAARGERLAANLLRQYPQAPQETRYGAHLVVAQSAFDNGRFALAEADFRAALSLLQNPDPRRADTLERLTVSIYRQGEQQRDAGQYALAAGHFLRIAEVAPASPIRAAAEFDAAAAFLQARQWQAATELLVAFRGRYPDHRLQPQVTRELAVAYLESSQWLLAAIEFERMAGQGADARLAREARWQAAELFEKAGERRRAIEAWARYVREYQQPVEQAMEARLRLLEIFRAAGDVASLRRWQRAIIAADARAGAQRSDRTRFLAAGAQLDIARDRVEAFRAIDLVAPIRRNIERKRDAMTASLDALARSADYGIAAVTTEATYWTAEVYHDFGRDLLASERPRDLDELALEEYELLLEEQAYPFEEKAIQAHGINAARTVDGLYDEWVRKSFAQLARLMPARFAKEERSVGVMAQLR